MKRLYKKLAITFSVSSLLIAVLFAVSLYTRSREQNYNYLDQLLESTAFNLKREKTDQEERIAMLKDDYLNRAWAVEYILSNDYNSILQSDGLLLLRELMEVKNISVIGKNGEILITTDDANADYYEDKGELDALLSSPEDKAYAIFTDELHFSESSYCFHVLVRSRSENFNAVRIDADVSKLGLMSNEELIKSTLKQATTEYATSIFAVDKKTGKLLGITENNRQQFQIDGVTTESGLLEFLDSKQSNKRFLVSIDGKIRQAVVHGLDNIYLVAFSDMEKVFTSIARIFLEGLLSIGAISAMTVFMVHYHIKRMEKELSLAKTEAKYDKLTGLYNRNGFEQCIEKFLSQKKTAGVLLLLDLDNFKKINDSEGHPEGDRVLENFAECLRCVFRREDIIGRLGGDEFIVLIQNELPEKILEDKLNTVLDGVRNMLGSYREKYEASVSIGAVPIDGSVKSYEALYKYADAALYIAKYMGKNRYYVNRQKITCAKEECFIYANNKDNNKDTKDNKSRSSGKEQIINREE